MDTHSGSGRLVILALALILTGFTGSALYWSQSTAPAFLAVQEGYGTAISTAAVAGTGASAEAEQQWGKISKSARLVEAHGHVLFLCIFLILFGILLSGLQVAERFGQRVAWLGIGGVLIYPAGLITQATGSTFTGQALSAAGALLILTFAGIMVAGLWWPGISQRPPGSGHSTRRD